MLVLSRKPNESIRIADNVTVKVLKVQGNRIVLGIDAPDEVLIRRSELADQDKRPYVPVAIESRTPLPPVGVS